MEGPLRFEEYLAQFAPGPELGAALAAIEPDDLNGHDRVWYLRAEYRQKAHQDMRVHRAVAAVARCDADGETAGPDEWSAHEVKAALGLTRYHANKLVADAWDLTHRCPQIGQAMADGELDWPRAEKLLEVTAGQSDAVTSAVVAAMLPRAALSAPKPETTGQIAEAAEELAIALDPNYAKSKYEQRGPRAQGHRAAQPRRHRRPHRYPTTAGGGAGRVQPHGHPGQGRQARR